MLPSGRPRCRYPSRTSHPEDTPLKSERERMDMITAYNDVGSYRGAAAVCGVDHKTVKRAVARPGPPKARPPAQLRCRGRHCRPTGRPDLGPYLGQTLAARSKSRWLWRLCPQLQGVWWQGQAGLAD